MTYGYRIPNSKILNIIFKKYIIDILLTTRFIFLVPYDITLLPLYAVLIL